LGRILGVLGLGSGFQDLLKRTVFGGFGKTPGNCVLLKIHVYHNVSLSLSHSLYLSLSLSFSLCLCVCVCNTVEFFFLEILTGRLQEILASSRAYYVHRLTFWPIEQNACTNK